jgi:hypothetical protein
MGESSTNFPSTATLADFMNLTCERSLAGVTSRYRRIGPTADDVPPLDADSASLAVFKKNRLSAHWDQVKEHTFHRWLVSQSYFRRAWQVFQDKKKLSTATAGMRSDEADFYFLYAIAWALAHFLNQRDPANRRRLPDKKTAKSAIGYITNLLSVDLEYIYLEPALVKSLNIKRRQLESSLRRRKVKEDNFYPQRRYVGLLIWQFLSRYGEPLHTAVHELCELIGYEVSSTALQVQIRQIKKRFRLVSRS